MSVTKQKQDGPTVIKKYANRRLYDTGRSSYVTLEDLCEMVRDGYDFVVYDAKTNEDLTRSVLTQIILDQESKGRNLLPTAFLRQLISFYGDSVQSVVPGYLESMLDIFTKNKEQLKMQISKAVENMEAMNNKIQSHVVFEDLKRENQALLEKTMKLFVSPGEKEKTDTKPPEPQKKSPPPPNDNDGL